MAKKQVTLAQPGTPLQICFERIVPSEVHPFSEADRAARRAVVCRAEAQADHPLSAEEKGSVTRMALVDSKAWPPGAQLRCRFLDGSLTQRKKVEEIAHGWEEHASIRLRFVEAGASEIRISFCADPGSWSAVGTDAKIQQYFPRHQPTMNFGWLKDGTAKREYSRVVLHEFGHALGCVHEHQSPRFDRKWNRARVLEAFSGPPNYWSQDEIDRNVLQKYSPRGLTSSVYDPNSIMLYVFDGSLFDDDIGPTNQNTKLSDLDIRTIASLYPRV